MTTVSGVAASNLVATAGSSEPVTVAKALATLKLRPGSTVAISDTVANLQKSLETLQTYAGRITAVGTSDATAKLTVSAAQYAKTGAILAKWGAGDGNTVDVTGIAAANAAAFAGARPSWVDQISVSDSAANVARSIDSLQSLAADGGPLRQITLTGSTSTLRISAAQLGTSTEALGKIRNQAYSLAITGATVAETLGLDGATALTANAKVKAIDVRDSTAAIEDNLDSLQRVGLKLRSLSQTDAADDPLTLSASQLVKDSAVLGKILTPYHLDVIRASAAQVQKLASNSRVVSITVADTAANIARRWSLMNRLADSLTAVEVTDGNSNAIRINADQLALGDPLLGKFSVADGAGFSLAISGARAGQAAQIAALDRVDSVSVADSADNIAANFSDLQAVAGDGRLEAVAVTGRQLTLSLDAARLLGDQAGATQGVLDKLSNRNVGLAVTGASLSAIDDLAGNRRVVSLAFNASSNEIEEKLDALQQLGRRLGSIDQSDDGTALDLTQAQFHSRAAVLAKVTGGYTVNLSEATAGKALIDAMNARVASIAVADSGRNIAANWRSLRAIGTTLAGISQTDGGALSLTAANYLGGQNDGLVGKFSAAQRFTLTAATVDEAQQVADDAAVETVNVSDEGGTVTARLTDLATLADGGKLGQIVLTPGTTRLAMAASQLDAAQGVLDKVKDGRYTLALTDVEAASVSGLLAGNRKIATVRVAADAQAITDNLTDLGAAGHKLLAITRTDAADSVLTLTGAHFEAYRTTLGKISGGYLAELTEVAAARAATLAAATQVNAVQVADSGANLAAAWNTLGLLGSKLGSVAQTDDALLALSVDQWTQGRALADKFSGTLGVSVSGASVADLASLGSDSAVQALQLQDNADTISAAWDDVLASFGGDARLTQISLTDPVTALTMSATTYAASSDMLGRVRSGAYSVALSDAALSDAAALQADSHVASFDASGASTDIAAAWDDLAGYAKLGTLSLSDEDGTLALSATQVLAGADTLAKIGNGYQLSAGAATLAQLADLQTVDNLATIGVRDSAVNVGDGLDDLVNLGSLLGTLQFSDDSPRLALTETDWRTAASTLAKVEGSYEVDLSEVDPASVASLSAEATVRQLSVSASAGNLVQRWSELVAAYGDGSSTKLAAISVSDGAALSLTQAQQDEGAAMISALLGGETIVTA